MSVLPNESAFGFRRPSAKAAVTEEKKTQVWLNIGYQAEDKLPLPTVITPALMMEPVDVARGLGVEPSEFIAKLKGAALSPVEHQLRRLQRQQFRAVERARRHASYGLDSDRQRQRYARNRMDEQQRNSHKPGTLQPHHIFRSAAKAS